MKSIPLEIFKPIDLTKNFHIPAYIQICDLISDLINQNILKQGQRFPGENLLAEHWKVSRATVRQAFRHLREDGFVYKRQGKGTVVANQPSKSLQSVQFAKNICLDYCDVAIDRIEMDILLGVFGEYMGNLLQADAEDKFFEITLFFISEKIIISKCVIFVLKKAFDQANIAMDQPDQIKEYLLEGIYDHSEMINASITAFSAKQSEEEKLALPDADVVLHVQEMLYNADQKPLAAIRSYLKAEYYRLPLIRRNRFA